MNNILKLLLVSLCFILSCEGGLAIQRDGDSINPDEKEKEIIEDEGKAEIPDPRIDRKFEDDTGPKSISRITRLEYKNTVQSIFGKEILVEEGLLPVDNKTKSLFISNAVGGVTDQDIDAYWNMGEKIADQIDVLGLCADGEKTDECAETIAQKYAPRLFKKEVPEDFYTSIRAHAVDLRDPEGGSKSSREETLRNIVILLLNLPDFLYHIEKVSEDEGDQPVSGFTIAERLAAFLWLEAPDEILLTAARDGELDTVEGIGIQARRLIADKRSQRAVIAFHRQWLQIERLERVSVKPEVIESFESYKDSIEKEIDTFVLHAFREGGFSNLMTANYSFLDEKMAALYGVTAPENAFDRVDNIPNRQGLLTMAGVLSVSSHGLDSYTQPIYRGLFLRESVLCSPVGPPANLDAIIKTAEEIEFTDDMNDREKLELLTSPDDCQNCHAGVDPYGFAMEPFDLAGQYRELDYSGKAINSEMELSSQGDLDGTYKSVFELSDALATSETFKQCYSKQWFRFALGRSEHRVMDGASLQAATKSLSSDNIADLLVAITTSYAFRHRRPNVVE